VQGMHVVDLRQRNCEGTHSRWGSRIWNKRKKRNEPDYQRSL